MELVEKVLGSDTVLFWLDEHICKENNCTQLRQEFETSTTNIYLFYDVDQCRRFLPKLRQKKVYCIIQGKHAQTIVPDIMRYTSTPVVYIFCTYMATLTEWFQDIECVLDGGIFNHEKDLLEKLTSDLADYAALKVNEYRVKRAACEEWADRLTQNAKRLRTENCTLTFRTDPFDDRDTIGAQPGD